MEGLSLLKCAVRNVNFIRLVRRGAACFFVISVVSFISRSSDLLTNQRHRMLSYDKLLRSMYGHKPTCTQIVYVCVCLCSWVYECASTPTHKITMFHKKAPGALAWSQHTIRKPSARLFTTPSDGLHIHPARLSGRSISSLAPSATLVMAKLNFIERINACICCVFRV